MKQLLMAILCSASTALCMDTPPNYAASQLLVTIKKTYHIEVIQQQMYIVPQAAPIFDQPLAQQEEVPVPNNGGFYCPYCDVRLLNWPAAAEHGNNPEHQVLMTREHKRTQCKTPDEYLQRNKDPHQ